MELKPGELYRTANGSCVRCGQPGEVVVVIGGHRRGGTAWGDSPTHNPLYNVSYPDEGADWPVYTGGCHPTLDIVGKWHKKNKER